MSTRPRRWLAASACTLVLAIALAWIAPVALNPIAVRDWLFATRLDPVASQTKIAGPPDESLQASISGDRTKARAIASAVFGEAPIKQMAALPTAERVQRLVSLLPGVGGHGCGTVSVIQEKATILRDNHHYGCCSDFTEVFLLLSLATGTTARELNNALHTFAEVWLPEYGEWMLVDPQMGLTARSPVARSGYMSAWGVRQAVRETGLVVFQRLPKDVDPARLDALIRTYHLDREAWATLRITRKSDVVSQSEHLASMERYAKWAVQFVAHVTQVMPGYDELQEPVDKP